MALYHIITISCMHSFILVFLLLSVLGVRAWGSFIPSDHTRNAAVIVQTSRFFHNYRHTSNALSIYQAVKKHGKIPDENIILMLAEDIPYNDRNPHKGEVFSDIKAGSLFDSTVEVDYRGEDVTVDNFLKVLLGDSKPGHNQLDLDSDTNLLVYLTGHGGDSFFKFQDEEELLVEDIHDVFSRMHIMRRFKEVLFIADTCQAFTLAPKNVPNVYSIGSSLLGQNSYANHADSSIGHSVIDRYTYGFYQWMEQKRRWDRMESISLHDSLTSGNHVSFARINADVGSRDEDCKRKFNQVPLSDFFAMKGVYNTHHTQRTISNASINEPIIKKIIDDQECSSGFSQPVAIEEGMHPSDMRFLLMLALFLTAVYISSKNNYES